MWDCGSTGNGEPCAEIIPKCDALLCTGLVEAEEGVSAVASEVAAGASTDLALGDLAADVVFGAVGVQRNLGPVENLQQLTLVGLQPCQQAVESDEACLAVENAIEAGSQGSLAGW